ncbi:hypothetical protein GYMLUDRAFT_70935 [Collybiopsis luxurians FD-317 M1]|nr:hypothetical protein GYMLUDRAFT_70935 [Collybiopsis luxurians FD-317 M1]
MSLMKLPDELLHCIYQNLVHTPPLPGDWLSENLHIEYASPALVSLSSLQSRLRRISLPFLFAYLRIKNLDRARKFQHFCSTNAICSQLVRMLTIDTLDSREVDGYEIVGNLFPDLKHLVCVDWRDLSLPSVPFLQALHHHPTVSTVLFNSELPYRCVWLRKSLPYSESDFSKVIISRLNLHSFHSEKNTLPDGAQITALEISSPDKLKEDFESQIVNGLRELCIHLVPRPVSFSWLPKFTLAHPHLHTIYLKDANQHFHVPPWMSFFFNEIARQGLHGHLRIAQIVLTRTRAEAQPTQQWYASGMSVSPRFQFLECLRIASSSFPSMENLLVEFPKDEKDTYSMDEVVATLSHFSSVRVLKLYYCCERVRFGSELPHNGRPVALDNFDNFLVHLKQCLQLCAARLAEAMPSLERMYFWERGSTLKPSEKGPTYRLRRMWWMDGWFNVCGASRNIEGSLELHLDTAEYQIRARRL